MKACHDSGLPGAAQRQAQVAVHRTVPRENRGADFHPVVEHGPRRVTGHPPTAIRLRRAPPSAPRPMTHIPAGPGPVSYR
jgi:hypothetical protein